MQTLFRRLFGIVLSVFVFSIAGSASYSDGAVKAQKQLNEVASFEFEDNTFDGWTLMGHCSFLLDSNIKYYGNSSLKISERAANWCGGSYISNDLLKAGHTYYFSLYVYQDSGQDDQIYATVRHTNSNGVTEYIHINDTETEEACTVHSGEWFEITGTAKIPEDTVSSLLYIESPNQSLNINLDHIIISEECEESDISSAESTDKPETSGKNDKLNEKFTLEFENSEINMIPRGETIRLVKTDERSNNGKHSLYVSQRESSWNGPSVSTPFLDKETLYYYSVYVYYDDSRGEPDQDFLINVSYYINGKQQFVEIGQKNVLKNKWTKVEGTCSIPENASGSDFSVQTVNVINPAPSDLIDFYIDDIEIVNSKQYQKQNSYKLSFTILLFLIALLVLIILITYIVKKRIKYLNYLKIKDIDEMTKVFNRNAYEKKLVFYEKNLNETKKLYVLTCDLDNLKIINDSFGHEKGDEAIKRCAETLRDTIGWDGEVYRIGGDEFICFTKISLIQICRTAIAKEGEKESEYKFSASLGQCSFGDLETDDFTPAVKDIIKKADEMMYKEKEEKKKQ